MWIHRLLKKIIQSKSGKHEREMEYNFLRLIEYYQFVVGSAENSRVCLSAAVNEKSIIFFLFSGIKHKSEMPIV